MRETLTALEKKKLRMQPPNTADEEWTSTSGTSLNETRRKLQNEAWPRILEVNHIEEETMQEDDQPNKETWFEEYCEVYSTEKNLELKKKEAA